MQKLSNTDIGLSAALVHFNGGHKFVSPPCGLSAMSATGNLTNIDHCNGSTSSTSGSLLQVRNSLFLPVTQTKLAAFVCPSDILPPARTNNNNLAKSNYCANQGSAYDLAVAPNTTAVAAGGKWTCGNSSARGNRPEGGVMTFDNNNDTTFMNSTAMVLDGTANTILIGEVTASLSALPAGTGTAFPTWAGGAGAGGCRGDQIGTWGRFCDFGFGINVNPTTVYSDLSFGSKHPAMAQFAMTDGSTRVLNQNINSAVYRALGTKDGKEAIP